MDSSNKRDLITSQNSIAYESESEIMAAIPSFTNSGKSRFTCKLCGSIVRSESCSSVSSDFTLDSLETSVCFKLCQKRLNLKGKRFLQKALWKTKNEKLSNDPPTVPYDMCNESSKMKHQIDVTSNHQHHTHKPLTCFGVSKLQRKIKSKKEAPLKSKTAKKSTKNSGKGIYISHDSDSSISGSSLVCIKDENESSDDNKVGVDETREVEEGIDNLMREHFEAKSAAAQNSKSQRHTIFRKIFSPKENEKSGLCKNESEKVEMEPLNKTKDDCAQNNLGEEEDIEEVRDKPTSLSQFSYNRERMMQKNRTSQHTLLKDGCELNGAAVRIKRKSIRRTNSDSRYERRVQRRNNNLGVCSDCKLRMTGSPLDFRSRTTSDTGSSRNVTLSTDSATQNHTTPLRSHSFRHPTRPPMLHSLTVSRYSTRGRKNDDSLPSITKRNNVSYSLSQDNSSQRTSGYMRRSLSAKSASDTAFRRTHSVRYPANNQETKKYTRRRTTTIGSCNFPGDENNVVSTVRTYIFTN